MNQSNNDFVLTREYIMSQRTEAGSWTRSQLKAIGVDWPPKAGWIDRVCGNSLSAENKRLFEARITAKEVRRHGMTKGLFES